MLISWQKRSGDELERSARLPSSIDEMKMSKWSRDMVGETGGEGKKIIIESLTSECHIMKFIS